MHTQGVIQYQYMLHSTHRPHGQNGPDDIFKRIFMNEKLRILIKISLKFVPKGPMDNNLVLV